MSVLAAEPDHYLRAMLDVYTTRQAHQADNVEFGPDSLPWDAPDPDFD